MNIIDCSTQTSSGCPPHSHPHWEIICRISGDSTSTIGDQTYSVSSGDLVIIPPEVKHFDVADQVYHAIDIQLDFLDFSDVLLLHDYSGDLATLMNMVHRTLLEKEANYRNIADSLMDAIYQYIKKLSLSIYRNPFVFRLKNLIYANVGNSGFDLTREIENSGFHPDYVRRCFKAETGKTPLAYLTWLRVSKAKQLLVQHTYESIETVAANCGFQDSFYFSTCFKKHTGLSPLHYRKNQKPL